MISIYHLTELISVSGPTFAIKARSDYENPFWAYKLNELTIIPLLPII
jgi:hypothetical protein